MMAGRESKSEPAHTTLTPLRAIRIRFRLSCSTPKPLLHPFFKLAEALRRMRCQTLAALFLVLVSGCAGLPPNTERTPSHVFSDTNSTALGQAVAGRTAAHPG